MGGSGVLALEVALPMPKGPSGHPYSHPGPHQGGSVPGPLVRASETQGTQLGPGAGLLQLKENSGTRARPETAELEGGADSPSTCHTWREDKVATKRTVPPRVPQSSFSTDGPSPAPRPPLGLQGPFQATAQMPESLMTAGGGCGQLGQEATQFPIPQMAVVTGGI